MAKQFFLHLLFRDQTDDSIFEIREQEENRIRSWFDNADSESSNDSFFWFETVDGKSVIVNVKYLQAIRYLWEATEAPSDLLRSEEPIVIYLNGRQEPLREPWGRPVSLYDFFSSLEHGREIVVFPYFEDEDGEFIQFNPAEIVRIEAPSHLIAEGLKEIESELDG